jgi:hypothetical protein
MQSWVDCITDTHESSFWKRQDTVYEPSLLGTHPFERAMLEAKQSFTPHKQSNFSRHKSPGSPEAAFMPG